jgi:transcriptional regulator with GAF, ATPase, and Fis domain
MPTLVFRTEHQYLAHDFPNNAAVTIARAESGSLRVEPDPKEPGSLLVLAPEPRLSQQHLRLRCVDGERWTIADLGSTNGTFARLPPQEPQEMQGFSSVSCGQVLTVEQDATPWRLPIDRLARGQAAELVSLVRAHLHAFVQEVRLIAASDSVAPEDGVTTLLLRGENKRLVVRWSSRTRSQEAEGWLHNAVALHNARAAAESIDKPWRFIAATPGRSQALLLARQFTHSDITVLLRGPSGSGKDVLAQDLHDHSPRRAGPFVAINCAAVPGELFEGELFGAVRGAYTSSVRNRVGLIESADHGTLFLDEVADLSLEAQAKLLRVLEERRVRPLGSEETRDVDVRILAATHKDLETMVQSGTFREDLYFRLCGLHIVIPPLGTEDIEQLAQLFLGELSEAGGVVLPVREASEVVRRAAAERWRGGARELRSTLTRYLQIRDAALPTSECWQRAKEAGSRLRPTAEAGTSTQVVPLDVDDPLRLTQLVDDLVALSTMRQMLSENPEARTTELAKRLGLTYAGAAARLKRYQVRIAASDRMDVIGRLLETLREELAPYRTWLARSLGE